MAQKIQVRVKTNCSEQKIENFGERHYLVYLKSSPEDNKANIELLNMMSKMWFKLLPQDAVHFGASRKPHTNKKVFLMSKVLGVPALKIKIVSGLTSRDKTLEIVY